MVVEELQGKAQKGVRLAAVELAGRLLLGPEHLWEELLDSRVASPSSLLCSVPGEELAAQPSYAQVVDVSRRSLDLPSIAFQEPPHQELKDVLGHPLGHCVKPIDPQ
eukprot:13143755-Alexandrium_andersonii.AAC.1